MEDRLNDLIDHLMDAIHIAEQLKIENAGHASVPENELHDPDVCPSYDEFLCKKEPCSDCMLSVPFNV